MNEEMEKCVLQNIPWANIPPAVKQVTYTYLLILKDTIIE